MSFGLILCLPYTGRVSEAPSGEAEKRIHKKTPHMDENADGNPLPDARDVEEAVCLFIFGCAPQG